MSTFKSVVTTLGQSRIAAAIAAGTDINITQLAVGDGNGKATTPVATQIKLVKEVYRTPLNSLKLDPTHGNWVIAEAVISASVGGFWMREMGLFSSDGALIAVCNMADTYKPTLAEGSGRTQTLRMVIAVSNTEAISLLIDDSLIMATEQYVNDLLAAHEKSRNHPDGTLTAKGFVQLSSSVSSTSETLAATPKAVKAVNDNANTRVPSTRKVNNKALSADIDLSAADVGALPVASAILGGVNINTLNLAKIGLYVQSTGANATVANGYPPGSQAAGVLEVIPASWTGGVLQRYTVQNTGMVWTRALNASWNGSDGPWRDWVQLSTVNSVSVPTSILTGTDINTLGFASGTGRAALYAQPKNANATPALNYPEKTAGTLHVMPSAYGCQQMYITFTGNTWNRGLSADWNGVDGPWKEWVPTYGANNKPTAADVGALASTGGVVTGEIKGTSATFTGAVTQRENIVGYRQLISRADAFSAYTTYNRLDQVEGVRPGAVLAVGDIAARLTTAAGDPYGRILGGVSFQYNTTGGGRLVLNARNDASVVKSSLTLDGDAGNTTFVGDVDFNGMVKFNRHEATCQFSASDAAYPLINVNYSNAGNFGFWDANNAKWLLRKRASNLTTGNADNWVMESGGLEITGAYGLTLTTALPVASGGTGAKTAANALKNLGAVPATGGDVGYLNNANHFGIKPGVWEGAGSFANQYKQPVAPFIVPYGYQAPRDVSSYAPVVKGVIQTTSYGYGTAVSFGALTSGGQKFATAVIHVIGDSGVSASWLFDPMDGSFGCPGSVSAGNIYSNAGIYEQGQRISTQVDAQNRANAAENSARNWAYSNCVQDIRFGTSSEFKERNNNENMNGGVMTSFKDAGSSNYWIRMRPLQKAVGGNWYTVGYV